MSSQQGETRKEPNKKKRFVTLVYVSVLFHAAWQCQAGK